MYMIIQIYFIGAIITLGLFLISLRKDRDFSEVKNLDSETLNGYKAMTLIFWFLFLPLLLTIHWESVTLRIKAKYHTWRMRRAVTRILTEVTKRKVGEEIR